MQGAFAGTAARLAGGIGIVGCAVVVALAAGGAGVFGGLGSLFGKSGGSLQVAKAGNTRADIVAAPATAALPSASANIPAAPPARHPARDRTPGARRTPQANPSPPAPAQPAPTPTLPAPPPPPPSPGSGQVTSTIADTVKQVANQAPPQAGPVTKPVEDVVDTLVQACQGQPACP